MNETEPSLPGGTYDVMVIEVGDKVGPASEGTTALSLVIVTGPFKGQVVDLGRDLARTDAFLLLGSPGRLTVSDRQLRLQLES